MLSNLRQTSPKKLMQPRLSHPSKRLPAEKKKGFAVLIALSLMSFVLVIVLSLILMASVEIANTANAKDRLLARENARLGLMIALGDLQKYAGPDQRVTARAEIEPGTAVGSEKWTGVWDTSGTGANVLTWLVSGDEPTPNEGATGEQSTTISTATPSTEPVRASWISFQGGGKNSSRLAYWVQEEGVKARVNLVDRTPDMPFLNDVEARQDVSEQVLQFPTQTKIFAELAEDPAKNEIPEASVFERLGRIETAPQLGLAFPDGVDSSELLTEKQHDYTTWSAGVLENALTGGLKTNLTGRTQEQIDEILALPENVDDHYLKGDFLASYNINPATGEPLARNANPNNPSATGSGVSSNRELVRIVKEDFYEFRDDATDPDDGESEVVRQIMPVVTEASFRLGAFHTQSDTKHRIRFHADVEFWNPYPFPIRFPGEGQSRVFTVMMVPSKFGTGRGRGGDTEQLILSVEKLGAGRGRGGSVTSEELHTNLFNFDEALGSGPTGGGATNNSINETVMTSWMTIDNVVLQPGEVYHATTSRAVGLARDLGGYILGPGGDREDPADYVVDPGHGYNKWSWHTTEDPTHPVFKPDERVRVSLRIPENGITYRLIPFDSRSTNNSPIYEENGNATWSRPVWELRHAYKIEDQSQLFDELGATEYSRRVSGDYTVNDYTMGFHFKLDDEKILSIDPDASAISLGFDLRQPVWDFDNPAVKRAVMVGGVFPEDALAGVEPNPMNAPAQRDLFFNGVDLFADGNPDTHGGSFERAILYPSVTSEPRSIGSFQHLLLSPELVEYDVNDDGDDEFVQLKVGMPWSEQLNEAFDKYFFSAAPVTGWTSGQPLPLPLETSFDVSSERLRERDAASELLVSGTFNLNSLSGPAWAAMIGRTLASWQYDGPGTATNLQNAILNLSNSTDDAIESFGSILEDEKLTAVDSGDINSPDNSGRVAMRYPLRQLENQQLFDPSTPQSDSLVEFLLDEMRAFFDANGPFTSVSDFVNSGVLQRAIDRSDINGPIARFAPAYITQASILEPIAPFLTVRSDTFVIRSVSELENLSSGESFGRVICEAVVQRIPNRVDGDSARVTEEATSNNNRFGRRFVIKSISWKETIL